MRLDSLVALAPLPVVSAQLVGASLVGLRQDLVGPEEEVGQIAVVRHPPHGARPSKTAAVTPSLPEASGLVRAWARAPAGIEPEIEQANPKTKRRLPLLACGLPTADSVPVPPWTRWVG
jgi:hypothetical protein